LLSHIRTSVLGVSRNAPFDRSASYARAEYISKGEATPTPTSQVAYRR
jgi:hypothetical protein